MNWYIPAIAPLQVVLFSFFGVSILFFAIGTWKRFKAYQASNPNQEIVAEFLVANKIELPPSKISISIKSVNLPTTLKESISLIFLGSIFSLVYGLPYIVLSNIIHAIAPPVTKSQQNDLNIAIGIIFSIILAWVILPLIKRHLILSSPEHKFSVQEVSTQSLLTTCYSMSIFSTGISTAVLTGMALGWFGAFFVLLAYYGIFLIL
jgi:hypothetical protein